MASVDRVDIHRAPSARSRIAAAAEGIRAVPARVRASEYVAVGQSRRFRAIQRRRTRAACQAGFIVIAIANTFDALALLDLQGDGVRLPIALDVATMVLAIGALWGLNHGLSRHPELVAWIVTFGVVVSTVATEVAVPALAVQSVGYLLVLPGLIALVLPWRTRVHIRWLLAYAFLAVGAVALDPGGRFTPDERGDLVVVLFVALGASLAGHVLLQRAQIRSFAQLEAIRSLRRLADAEMVELERAHHALELSARIDPLTGSYNRRRLEEDLRAVRAHIDRSGMTYGLLMIDLDRFKGINDRRGHLAGDDVLRRVVAAIEASVRADDAVYRYGGEEFVAILAVPTRERLLRAAERLQATVSDLAIEHVDNPPWGVVSISIGATLLGRFNLDLSAEQWVGQTDTALYAAKEAGRNCVRFAADRPIPSDDPSFNLAEPEPAALRNQQPLRGAALGPARTPRRRSTD